MSLETRLKAAVDLLSCSPPHRTRGMQKDIVTIHQSSEQEEHQADGEFIESLLSVADQLVVPVRCTICGGDGAGGTEGVDSNLLGSLAKARCAGWYLPSEFNRDGDHYRCPWCNQYPTSESKSSKKSRDMVGATFFPSEGCRQLEQVANVVFGEYAQLYYGDGSVSSCYAWDVEDGSINVAVMFAQRHRLTADGSSASHDGGARAMTNAAVGNVWTSTHIITAEPNAVAEGLFSYQMQSTFYLDLSPTPSGGLDEWGEPAPTPAHMKGCQNRCSGFVTHTGKPFSNKKQLVKTAGNSIPHVALIGSQIQKIENRIRGLIGEIYFSRMGQAVAKFRGEGKKQKVMVTGNQAVNPPSGGSNTASPRGHQKPIGGGDVNGSPSKEEKQHYIWEEVLDETGNAYFYNTITEESAWEHPGGLVKPLKRQKKSKSQEALGADDQPIDELDIEVDAEDHEEEATLEFEGEELDLDLEEELTVEGLLDTLALAGEVSSYDYARALRKSALRIKTTEDLIALGYDDSQDDALSEIIEAYGDRRKICKWIRKNQPPEEEEDTAVVVEEEIYQEEEEEAAIEVDDGLVVDDDEDLM